MPDTITPPNTTVPASTGAKPGMGGWVSQHKGLAIGGGLALLVGAYLLFRSKSNASSTANTSATGTPATVYPTSSGITGSNNAGDYYAGILNQLNSNDSALSSQLTGLDTGLTTAINALTAAGNPATGSTTTGSSSGSAAAGSATGPTYQTADIPGIGQVDVLGQVGANKSYTGYNVGGGAPVYFGNLNGAAQGPQGEIAGNYAYTPTQYQSLISATQATETL